MHWRNGLSRAKEKERKWLVYENWHNERAKKANLHNRKLRDCCYHMDDEPPNQRREEYIAKQNETTIFITEGDSASGSIHQSKKRGDTGSLQPSYWQTVELLWSYQEGGVLENEEFNLLQHALNIEEGLKDSALTM